jgi:hypothetical protein
MNAHSKRQGPIVVPKVDAARPGNHYKKNLPPRRADSPQVDTAAVKLASPDSEKYLITPSIFLLQFHRTSRVGGRTFKVGQRTSRVRQRTSKVGQRTSKVGYRTSKVGQRTSRVRQRTSRVRQRTSRVGQRTSRVGQDCIWLNR